MILARTLRLGDVMIELAIFTVTSVLATVMWGLSQSSRISVLEQKQVDTKELLESKLEEISRRLGRIELALNGALHRSE